MLNPKLFYGITMRILILCNIAWDLYDKMVRTGKRADWLAYLKHRKICQECKVEIKLFYSLILKLPEFLETIAPPLRIRGIGLD